MADIQIKCIAESNCTLGEGPVWDSKVRALYWVDILDNKIFRYDESTGALDWWATPEHIGFLILTGNGGLIGGLKTGLHHVKLQDRNRVSVSRIDRVDEGLDYIRFNDGICDQQGRIWGCTMDMNQESPLGKYYRYDQEMNRTVIDEGYVVANGPALTSDGQKLYTVETVGGPSIEQGIYVIELDGNKKPVEKQLLIDWEGRSSVPDGIITDANGNLWVGEFGGNTLRCFYSEGILKQEIELPAWNITKATVGGANLDTIYATSARLGVEKKILGRYPQTGGVFEISGLEVQGQQTPYFGS